MSITDVIEREMLIDRALTRFDFTRVEHVVVEANPETTYAAVRRLDFLKVHSPLWRRRGDVGARGARHGRAYHRPAYRTGAGAPELDVRRDGRRRGRAARLAEARGGLPREIAFGAIGKFWQMDITWLDAVPETPEAFTAFDDAGWGKIAANFSVRPYGDGRSLLSYEARTAMTDEPSRMKFGRYLTRREPVRRRHHAGDVAYGEGGRGELSRSACWFSRQRASHGRFDLDRHDDAVGRIEPVLRVRVHERAQRVASLDRRRRPRVPFPSSGPTTAAPVLLVAVDHELHGRVRLEVPDPLEVGRPLRLVVDGPVGDPSIPVFDEDEDERDDVRPVRRRSRSPSGPPARFARVPTPRRCP